MNIFLGLSICFISLSVLTACGGIPQMKEHSNFPEGEMPMFDGGTWHMQEQAAPDELDIAGGRIAAIERMKTRRSPNIKTFMHIELNIYKESAGSRWNDSYAIGRVETLPGKVQIGVVAPRFEIYHPEVEFTAEPDHNYLITWVCIPYPYVAIVDAESLNILALDSYCPDCKKLIGAPLLPSTKCLKGFYPPGSKLAEETSNKFWGIAYEHEYDMKYLNQLLKNLCFAAENGVTSAQMKLAKRYIDRRSSMYDPVRSYVWYLLAARAGGKHATYYAERLEEDLSVEQLEKASQLLNSKEKRQCEKDMLIPLD